MMASFGKDFYEKLALAWKPLFHNCIILERGESSPMDVYNPHDKFFKEMLGDVETAKDFIANYLPEKVLNVMDVNTLEVQKTSFINKDLQESHSDLLFKVNICNEEGYVYLLFEHKSYLDRGVVFQLLQYMIEIWEAKRKKEQVTKLPIIIPLVIYHGLTKWKVPTKLSELFNGYDKLPEEVKAYVPNFSYLLYDVSQYSDEDMKGSLQTRILLTLLRDMLTKTGEPLRKSIDRALKFLLELEDKETTVGYLETMLRYIFSTAKDLTEKDAEQIKITLESAKLKGSEFVMTLADIWREQGKEQGIKIGKAIGKEIGKEIGRAETLSQMAVLQLTSKFGTIPESLKEEITRADVTILEQLLKEIFSIENIDDVKRYFN